MVFGINGGSTTGGGISNQQQQQQQPTNTITISPSSTTGDPGETETISVTSSPTGVLVTLSSNDFDNTNFSPQSGITPFTSTLTLPSTTRDYTFHAYGDNLVSDSATVTVEAPPAPGTLSIAAIGTPVNGQQTVEVTARDAAGTGVADVTVTLSGAGFITRTVTTLSTGSARAIVALPSTTGLHILNAGAKGYNPESITLSATGQTPPGPTTSTAPRRGR